METDPTENDKNEPQERDSALTAKQEALIAALLVEPTQEGAAARVGVHRSTVHAWMQDEVFRSRLRAAKKELWDHSMGRLQSTTGEAIDTLREVMVDPANPAAARVTAARTVLDQARQSIELADLEDRLRALEERREAQ